jgi:ATP-dependent Zn protease
MWSTAVHEAGHAVVSVVLGFGCHSVTIIPDYAEETSGCMIRDGDQWAALERWWGDGRFYRDEDVALRAMAIIWAAGAAAEIELLGSCAVGDGDDRYNISSVALSVIGEYAGPEGDARWDRWLAMIDRQARRMVRRHRDKIEKLAHKLMSRQTMSGQEIDAFLHATHLRHKR